MINNLAQGGRQRVGRGYLSSRATSGDYYGRTCRQVLRRPWTAPRRVAEVTYADSKLYDPLT
eukprot:3314661-Prymnesium_polylepis.1